ncbi:MAG: cytochrome c biogenesis protein CcsA [Planctomycetota bacterium]
MSTITAPGGADSSRPSGSAATVSSVVVRCLELLASLKFTVVLFLFAMVIVFIGSLAQARRDVWLVMGDYFRCFVAKVDVQDLFPPSMSGTLGERVAESMGRFRFLPFPGGWTIGWLMLLNLISAHVLRFHIRTTVPRLVGGLAFILAGLLMLAAIVITGNSQTGVESGNTILSERQIWGLMLGVLGVSGVASVLAGWWSPAMSRYGRGLLLVLGGGLAAISVYYIVREFTGDSGMLSLSAMRILWQLLKASACSLVLLLGCNLLFEKRGGIALLHFGVALLMFSELQVGLVARENSLSLVEGEELEFARDIRERELAVIHREAGRDVDQVVVVPEALLEQAAPGEDRPKQRSAGGPVDDSQKISLPDLPFDIAVRNFHRNCELRPVESSDTPTNSGLGSFAAVNPLSPVTGMDGEMDQSAVLVDLLEKESGKVLNSLLLAQNVNELTSTLADKATVDGSDYYFYLRFKRNYRPYSVKLLDVSRTNYVGSPTPRDFRSTIRINEDGQTQEFTLWMNNPLRYKGETFYQSDYRAMPNGQEMSTLSVVKNTGWMLPYIACMIVAFGMFAQFGQTLLRFLSRFERQKALSMAPAGAPPLPVDGPSALLRRPGFAPATPVTAPDDMVPEKYSAAAIWIPVICTALFAMWVLRGMVPPRAQEQPADGAVASMNLYEAAKTPIAWNGRAQPLDSLARTMLLMSSARSTFQAELESWQISQPDVRKELLERVKKAWPTADVAKLESFEGGYPEWLTAIAEAVDARPEDVEPSIRDLLVRRAPAVHWLLDLITRPELASRHRVIRIEDDRLLAALQLQKRPGFVYSLDEVRKNFTELRPYIEAGQQKQRQKKEFDLQPLEQRSLALFETVSRFGGLEQMFQTQPAENLFEALINAWRLSQQLQETRAAMAVPTGTKDAQKSWETYVLASALRDVNKGLREHSISTPEQLATWAQNDLPLSLVRETIIGTWAVLETASGTPADNTAATDVPTRAGEALSRVRDPYLLRVLAVISQAQPCQTAAQVADSVTKEMATMIASARIAQDLFQVIDVLQQQSSDDPRLAAIRSRLTQFASNEEQLATAANREILTVVWTDLHKRAGEVLPGGSSHESFSTAVGHVTDIFNSWRDVDPQKFNTSVAAYHAWLDKATLPHVDNGNVRLEAWFNFFDPFNKAIYIYFTIIVLVFTSWLFFSTATRRTAIWLLGLGFVIHTAALWLRIEISGRPPVTNLYSSAIFIGWAVVLAAFAIELFIRNGLGSLVGGAAGSGALMIAHYLAADEGDTLGVMQAVLDTAFWLATHVVCITLGYAATFVAGFLGICYCGMLVAQKSRGAMQFSATGLRRHEQLGRMVYGVLCFALFFSMVGTVLGGLWADDSWGRFWGWDPKENGAMLIVIWNALILHARWDKMIGDFGTSILAMLGNVVTAWSWFGVNELRAGLHSYGFTEGRLLYLAGFVAVQLLVIAVFLAFARPRKKAAVA